MHSICLRSQINSPTLQQLCATGALGDERHVIFECPKLQYLGAQWSHLSQGPELMQAFMWQDNLIGVAKFVNMCLNKVNPTVSPMGVSI